MRTSSIARGAAAALSALGTIAAVSFFGCGGEDPLVLNGTSGGADAGPDAEQVNCVIDGKVSDTEKCDDGNTISGDGCENDCVFTCDNAMGNGNAQCDDADPCNGAETCSDKHTCDPGKQADDGTACGAGKVCKAGVCSDVTCGDAFVTAPEECDDGNLTDGDGCDSCKFSCVSKDPLRDCSGGDPCAGTSTCDDSVHTCTPGIPLANGTDCGPNAFCVTGVCTASVCGNAVVEMGEKCDDGNPIDGDGCDTDCAPSCSDPKVDCAAPPACQIATCSAQATCTTAPDAAQENMPCAPNLVCKSGACIGPAAVCGNGSVEVGEQCDFGAQNGPGTGCEASCQFSCTMAPDSCPDADACNGVETCTAVMVGGQAGQKCSAGAALADCTSCAGGLCVAGACKVSLCGDGCVDGATGEKCEPPGSPTCDATCQTIVVAACGNGAREGTEQCDDGNTTNLDGCDSACKFEQNQRAQYLKMQFNTDAYCTANQLGAAISGGTAQGQLQTGLDDGIMSGATTILFTALGLDDLSGTSDPTLELGTLSGAPETLMQMLAYNGTNDLDWWHNINLNTVDANRVPLNKLPASIAAKVLDAGPGTMDVPLILANNKTSFLHMSTVKLTCAVGATSSPLMSMMNQPPGHLASEHLDPALTSFASCGQKTVNGAGKICGNVSALSLSQVPIPAQLTMGFTACSQGYQVTNSMLDVLIGGCTILFSPQIVSKQPDTWDPNLPPAGAGGPYVLTANAQKVVTTCKDKNGQTVALQTCLAQAAYSAYFKFATGRVIAK